MPKNAIAVAVLVIAGPKAALKSLELTSSLEDMQRRRKARKTYQQHCDLLHVKSVRIDVSV
jgi:malonyl CoA-acyl carrier protein transacylase